jgi:hypothetical protein
MPAIELKSSRLKNSNHLFLILNGTSIFSRKTVPVAGYSAIKAGWLKTTIAGFACQPSPTAAPERADVRIIVENGQNLISSRTAFLSNAKFSLSGKWRLSMITDSFRIRTMANMEVALERACRTLSNGSESHDARRFIAGRILKRAERGEETLGALTQAGLDAAMELEAAQRAREKR